MLPSEVLQNAFCENSAKLEELTCTKVRLWLVFEFLGTGIFGTFVLGGEFFSFWTGIPGDKQNSLCASVRCLSKAASSIRYSASLGGSAMPAQHTRSTGLLCGWPVALELSTRQLERSGSRGRDSFRRLLKTHLFSLY